MDRVSDFGVAAVQDRTFTGLDERGLMQFADTSPFGLRLASYNIRKAIGTDRRRDPDRILSVVADVDADVVVLQEADKRLGQRPTALPFPAIDALPGYRPVPVAANDVSLGWHGNAMLVRDGVKILDVDRISLGGPEPRGAILAALEKDGFQFDVVGVHLALILRYRQAQLHQIVKVLGERRPAPVVITGDFNAWRKEALQPLKKAGLILPEPKPSYHARRPVAALDRIALSPGWTCVESGVIRNETTEKASDHLPIWSDLTHEKTG